MKKWRKEGEEEEIREEKGWILEIQIFLEQIVEDDKIFQFCRIYSFYFRCEFGIVQVRGIRYGRWSVCLVIYQMDIIEWIILFFYALGFFL